MDLFHGWPHDVGIDLALAKLCMFADSISAKLKVALLAPIRAPWVLDEPIFRALLAFTLTVTNNCDGMVNFLDFWVGSIRIAIVGHNDTLFVVVHTAEVWIVGCTHRLFSKPWLQEIIRHIWLLSSTLIVEASLLRWILTLLLLFLVPLIIVIPADDAILRRPIVRVGHPTTIATEVGIVTIQQILDAEGGDVVLHIVSDWSECLERRRRCESPTRATTCLVDVSILINLLVFPADLIWQEVKGVILFLKIDQRWGCEFLFSSWHS